MKKPKSEKLASKNIWQMQFFGSDSFTAFYKKSPWLKKQPGAQFKPNLDQLVLAGSTFLTK
jgi:hypothetical protein